jgi:hypothetical protein
MTIDAKNWMGSSSRANAVARALPAVAKAPAAEPEDEAAEESDPSKAYGGVWNRRDRAHTLEFRFRDPHRPDETLDYNFLPRVQWRKAEGEIVLVYDALGVTVVICGLNLWELKERIRQHLVTWVQEQGDDEVAVQRAKEMAKEEGREFVLVQEIRFDDKKADESEGNR